MLPVVTFLMPLALGGLGLRSAVMTSPAAFVASVACALPHMTATQRLYVESGGYLFNGVRGALNVLAMFNTNVLFVTRPPKKALMALTPAQRKEYDPVQCSNVKEFVQFYGVPLARQGFKADAAAAAQDHCSTRQCVSPAVGCGPSARLPLSVDTPRALALPRGAKPLVSAVAVRQLAGTD